MELTQMSARHKAASSGGFVSPAEINGIQFAADGNKYAIERAFALNRDFLDVFLTPAKNACKTAASIFQPRNDPLIGNYAGLSDNGQISSMPILRHQVKGRYVPEAVAI